MSDATMHPGAGLLRVQPVRADGFTDARAASYRILWMANAWDQHLRQLFVVPPGAAANLTFGRNCVGYSVSFPEEMLMITGCGHFYPFAAAPGTRARQPVSATCSITGNGRAIERMIVRLTRECGSFRENDSLLIPGLLKVLLISVSRLFQQPEHAEPQTEDYRLFQQFIQMIGESSTGRKGIRDYARALSVRPDVLTETVRKVSGQPASHHIYQQIIRVAKQAAIASGASMKEVAYGLGFKDMAHFSKFFRNKTGMTFSDYKRIYQKI